MPIEPQKPYISSKQAAKKFGLTSDHIGLLCRRGKVQALLWGRVWYVSEPSLNSYARKNSEVKELRKRELSKQWRAAWTAAILALLFCGVAPQASADYVTVRVEPLYIADPTDSLQDKIKSALQNFEMPAVRPPQLQASVAQVAISVPAHLFPDVGPLLYQGVLELGDITASVIEAGQAPVYVTYITPPQEDTSAYLAALVEANSFLSDTNEAMFGLYAQSLASVGAAVRFDAEQFVYVWDKTFGAFGKYFVQDLSRLNDIQVSFYFAAAQKIELAYAAFADHADATLTLDSSISVASVSLAPITLPGGEIVSDIVDGFKYFAADLFGGIPSSTAVQPGCGT